MNFRTTLFLLVLVAAAAATLYFTRDRATTPSAEKTEEHKLVDLTPADVTQVTVTNSDDKKLVLQREGMSWKMTSPAVASAKTFEVDDLVRNITDLKSRGQADASKKSAGGLDKPAYVVQLVSSAKTVKLSFGDKSSLGDSVYVQVNDSDKPDVIGNSIYTQLDKPYSSYRETKLLSVASDQVKQLFIMHKGKTLRLQKDGTQWEIVEPVKLSADPTAVSDLLSSITNLNAAEFVENPGGMSKYGLNHPRYTIGLSAQPPATQPTTNPTGLETFSSVLRIGGYQDLLKKNVYASVDGSEIAVVPATSEQSFDKTALDLRNKDVVSIDPEKVSTITLAINRPAATQPARPADDRTFTLERRKETAPILGPALPPTASTTQPASTQPASTQPGELATTTRPTSEATTSPATQSAPAAPQSKWGFAGGEDANDEQVKALLDAFHPLHADKFIENSGATQPAATVNVTIHTIAARAGQGDETYVVKFTDESDAKLVGAYEDATFELPHALLDKLVVDFKPKKP